MEIILVQRLTGKLAAERLESRLAADARARLDAWHRDWLALRRAAARLGIPPRTLKAWMRRHLPARKTCGKNNFTGIH